MGNFPIVKARPGTACNTSEYTLMAPATLFFPWLMCCCGCLKRGGLAVSQLAWPPECAPVAIRIIPEVPNVRGAKADGRNMPCHCADFSSAAAPCDKWFQSRLHALVLTLTIGQAQPMEKMRSNKAWNGQGQCKEGDGWKSVGTRG